jgi:hypothetical protein
MQQIELFPFEVLSADEVDRVCGRIRNSYWHVRNLRKGRFGQAALRRHYREIAAQKKRLQLAGVSKRKILDFLSCCRLQCSAHKQPFKPCPYCSQYGM